MKTGRKRGMLPRLGVAAVLFAAGCTNYSALEQLHTIAVSSDVPPAGGMISPANVTARDPGDAVIDRIVVDAMKREVVAAGGFAPGEAGSADATMQLEISEFGLVYKGGVLAPFVKMTASLMGRDRKEIYESPYTSVTAPRNKWLTAAEYANAATLAEGLNEAAAVAAKAIFKDLHDTIAVKRGGEAEMARASDNPQ